MTNASVVSAEDTGNVMQVDMITSQATPALAPLSVPLVPLLSLTLRLLLPTTSENYEPKDLLMTCLKRQLVGQVCRIQQPSCDNDSSSTTTTTNDSDDVVISTEWRRTISLDGSNNSGKSFVVRLQVQSMVPQKNRTLSDQKDIPLGLILPSTRITVLSPKQRTANEAEMKDTTSRHNIIMPPRSMSRTTKILVDTLHCLRDNSSNKCPIPKSFLLSGPPGVGKTYAVQQAYEIFRRESNNNNNNKSTVVLYSLGSLFGSANTTSSSDVARLLLQQFNHAAQRCQTHPESIAIIFLDECDALLSSSSTAAADDDDESNSVAGMLSYILDQCNDSTSGNTYYNHNNNNGWQRIVVVAATNRVGAIPSYLRRPGRFDQEIVIGSPTVEERVSVLQRLLQPIIGVSTGGNNKNDFKNITSEQLWELAESCVGYVPADLAALVRRAVTLFLQQGVTTDNGTTDTTPLYHYLQRAMIDVGASALRDSKLSAPPTTTWDDVAGNLQAKTTLRQAIEWPRTKRDAFRNLGLVPPKGILLYGPPGCAKTTLARAAAGASGSGFISLAPADVYGSSYVGEAESIVRNAFKLARSASPCILFFDEIDSILGSTISSSSGSNGGTAGHGMHRGRGSSAESRVLSTFLNEMDGVDGSLDDGVLVLGATNRPRSLDKALLRPGRFDKIVYVPPPDYHGRLAILKKYCDKWNTANVDLSRLASDEISGFMTGAEIVGACRVAAMKALRSSIKQEVNSDKHSLKEQPMVQVLEEHLEESLRTVQPLLAQPSGDIMHDYVLFEESCRRG